MSQALKTLIDSNDWPGAISECSTLISNEDNESVKFKLFVTLAKCFSEARQFSESISAYRDAAKLNDSIQDPKFYKQFAEVLEKNKEYDDCIVALWCLYSIVTSKKNFAKSLEVLESIRDKIQCYKKDLKVDFLREICSDFYFYLTGKAQSSHVKTTTVSTPGLVDLITSVHIMNMISTLIDIQTLYGEKKNKFNVKSLSSVSAEDRQAALDEELNPNHVCPMLIEHAFKVLHGTDSMTSNSPITENMMKLLYQQVNRKRSDLFIKKTVKSDVEMATFMTEAIKVLSLDVRFYAYTHSSDDKGDVLPVSGYVLEAWISLYLRGHGAADHDAVQHVLNHIRYNHIINNEDGGAEIPECVYMAVYAVAAMVGMEAGCLISAQQDIVVMKGCQATSSKQVAESKKSIKTSAATIAATPSVYTTLVQLVCLLSHTFTYSIEKNINESLSYSADLIKKIQLDRLGQNWYQVCLLMRVIAIGSTGQVKGATKHYAAFLASLPVVDSSTEDGGVARLVASLEQHPMHSKLIYLRLFFNAVRVLQYYSIAAPFARAVLSTASIEDEGCVLRLSLEAAYGQAIISLVQCLSSVNIDLNEAKVSAFQIMDEMLYSLDVSSLPPMSSSSGSSVVEDAKSTISASITSITDLLTAAKTSTNTTIVDMLPEVYLRLAHLQWMEGGDSRGKKGALASALACAKLKSNMPGAMTLVGHVYLQVLTDVGKATKCYLKALSTNALDKEAGVLLSRIYILAEQPDKALKLWADVLTLTPHAAWAYDIRARYYLSVGNYENAVVDFQHLLEADADRAITWYLIGVCYSKLLRLQSAYRAFHTSLSYCNSASSGASSDGYSSGATGYDGNDMQRVNDTCIIQELALICSRLGNLSEAHIHYSTALAAYANPDTCLAIQSPSGYLYTLKNVADLSLIRGYLYNSWGWSEEVGRSAIQGIEYLQKALPLRLTLYPAASDEAAKGKCEIALYKLMGDLCCLARYCSSEELMYGVDALAIEGTDRGSPHLSYYHKAQQCYQLVIDRLDSPSNSQERAKGYYDIGLSYYLEASELMALSGQGNGFYLDRLLHRDAKVAGLQSKAANAFLLALENDSLHSDSWVALALTHAKSDTCDNSPTELCLLQSIAIDKNSAAYINLGVLYMRTGQPNRAMGAFNQSQVPTQANYNPSHTWVGIGHLYEHAHQLNVAADAYEVALEVDRPAQALLGKIMTTLKQLQGQSPDGNLPTALGCWLGDTTATTPYFSSPVSIGDDAITEMVPENTSSTASLPGSLLDMKRCLCRYVRIRASQTHAWLLLAWVSEQLNDPEEALEAFCTTLRLVHKYSELYISELSRVESKDDAPDPSSETRLMAMATHCCTAIFRLVANLVLREVYVAPATDIDIKAAVKKRLDEMFYVHISESEMAAYMTNSPLRQVKEITDLASLVQIAVPTTAHRPSTEYLAMLVDVINTGSAQALTEYITASNEALLQGNEDTARGLLNALCLYRNLRVFCAKLPVSMYAHISLQDDMHSYLWSCMDFGDDHPLFALLCQPSHLTYLYWTLTTMMPLDGSVDNGHDLSLVIPLLEKALQVSPLCAMLWLYLGHCGGGRAPVLADALTVYASDRLKVDMASSGSEGNNEADSKQRDYTSHQCAATAISLLRSMEHILAGNTPGLQTSNALIGLNRPLMANTSAAEAHAYRCLAKTVLKGNEEAKQRFLLLAARLQPDNTELSV